jgi:hypothetical protein
MIGSKSKRSIPGAQPIDQSSLNAIRDRTKSIFIWGRIDCTDAFQKVRCFKFHCKNGLERSGQGWELETSNEADGET